MANWKRTNNDVQNSNKKSNALDKSNYRPVSILPVISTFLERAINDQLVLYFSKIIHPYLFAFRSGYGCQTALLKIIVKTGKRL